MKNHRRLAAGRLALALLVSFLAGCGSPPDPIIVVVTSAPTATQWIVMVLATSTPAPPTLPPTATPIPTSTPNPTDTPIPTDTPVPTDTPIPGPTPKPVKISVAGCAEVAYDAGRPVWATGYLVVPAGSYNLSAWSYQLWLRSEFTDDAPQMNVTVGGGRQGSSMYFDGNTPHILNNAGDILPWYQSGGQMVYITTANVKVTGTWNGNCSMFVDRIDVVSW